MSECFLSPSLVSVLCSSRGAELTMKGFALRCNPICQEEFIIEETCAVIKKICSSPCFFFFSLFVCFLYLSHQCLVLSLVYLLLPCCCSLQNSKAFLKCRASLSIEPVSPSKPCWKLCCSVLRFLVSHLLILQCVCMYV